jgi:replicative DNA helicase
MRETEERELIGLMLADPEFVGVAMKAGLVSDDFGDRRLGQIYLSMEKLHDAGRRVDYLSVAEDLNRDGVLISVGGPAFLLGLDASAFNSNEFRRRLSQLLSRDS